ncbi:MAG: mechanosensitive ion channel [Chitinispirillaceae bacterium]|nr:mechanosensitive ion channel [Chitinispirillaceae bacterium]
MNWDLSRLFVQVQDFATSYGMKIVGAVLILIAGRIVAGIVRTVAKKAAKKTKADTTITVFLGNIAYILVMVFAVIAAVNRLGVQTTSFVAILGAAGLAVGLAFQGSLSNFASGFLMVIFRPFKVGDYVQAGGVAGTVKEIHVFTTTLTTPDNIRIIVPNSKITGDNITNYTAEEKRRIDLTVGVSYGDDLDKVTKVLKDVVTGFPGVLADPEPQIAVSEMADSSVNFVVRPWSKTGDYWTVRFGVTEAIKKRLDKEGISIPFPQQDVHLYNK